MFSTNYTPIFQLITKPRLSSFRSIFNPTTDAELYGIYLWSQHLASLQYPLLQAFEVCLRNTIDLSIKSKFGNFWWDTIPCKIDIQKTKFYHKIIESKNKLAKLSIKKPTHDQIIAATDLSTWQFILDNVFSDRSNNRYLWPSLFAKCFTNHSILSSSKIKAHAQLKSLINDTRIYRNRIFHHETLWGKIHKNSSPEVVIDYIEENIDKIIKIISCIDKKMEKSLNDTGIILNVKRACSLEELRVYSLEKYTTIPNIDSNIKSILIKNITDTSTLAITDDDKVYCAYRKR